MTDREKAIVMAHTGVCMLAGEKFGVFHAYIEDIMGRPVYTHELAIQSISDEIKEKSLDDFIKLCKEEQEPSDDAISRQAVLNKIKKVCFSREQEWVDFRVSQGSNGQRDLIINFIEDLPPVTPQPKTGHWIRWYEQKETEWCIENIPHCKCSECDKEYDPHSSQFIKYCNECGAKMQESEEV